MKIKVISWNIAGGHKIASLNTFDYQDEDLKYFANQIKKFNPDIICLQETQTKSGRSNAKYLENLLGIKVIVNSVNSPSHIDKNYRLGNSILSKLKPSMIHEYKLPNPEGDLFWSDGRKAVTHGKNLQCVKFEKFNLANSQMLPVILFGFKYDDEEGRGKKLVYEINDVVSEVLSIPIIWCSDFNYSNPVMLYKHIQKLNLRDALPKVSTRPAISGEKKMPDHILYSKEFKVIQSKVVKTKTDHYLCYAQFELN